VKVKFKRLLGFGLLASAALVALVLAWKGVPLGWQTDISTIDNGIVTVTDVTYDFNWIAVLPPGLPALLGLLLLIRTMRKSHG